MKKREKYYDFLRGVAIIMVIGIHTYVDDHTHFNLLFRQFLNCAVPMFLAISGYFIGRKALGEGYHYLPFLRKQVARVYIPMLIWSVPWAVMYFETTGNLMLTCLKTIVGGMSVFYFVTLIIQYYVLTPVLITVNKRYRGGYSMVITLIALTIVTYLRWVKGVPLSLVPAGSPFPVWMVFYTIGILKAQDIGFPLKTNRPLLFALLSIVFCCMEILVLKRLGNHIVPGIKMTTMFYSIFVIQYLFSQRAMSLYDKLSGMGLVKWIEKMGVFSFFIYLVHYLILHYMEVYDVYPIWSLRFVLLTLLSFLVAALFHRLLPKRLLRYVGF